MEFNHSIPKTKHIHKTIPSLLFTVALLLCAALISPLTAHADYASTQVEAEHSDGTYTSSNGTWLATYCPEAGYKGQGVLLYLLERNGGGPVAGTSPKAFACSPTMKTYELHAKDKYNRYNEVTTWESTPVYWKDGAGKAQGGGFMKDSITSNVPAIKDWLKTPSESGNSTQGIWLVKSIWGQAVAERFTNEEIILIAEPIVAVQFSQYYNFDPLDLTKGSLYQKKGGLVLFKNKVLQNEHTVMTEALRALIDSYIDTLDAMINGDIPHQEIDNDIIAMQYHLAQFSISTKLYKPLGKTYAGTSKMVASYYASLTAAPPDGIVTWYKSDSGSYYYRKSASASAYVPQGSIICANANFNLWDKGPVAVRQIHSDFNLQTYSIGMLAMLAFTSDDTPEQTTCDENLLKKEPPEHPAPIESEGTTTIIKSYRIRNTETNTLTDSGTYTRSNLSNQILIEDEGCYQVIAWKTSTENITNLANFSVTWESSVPGIIGEQGDTITQVELPPSHKYLYVLLEKPDTPPM